VRGHRGIASAQREIASPDRPAARGVPAKRAATPGEITHGDSAQSIEANRQRSKPEAAYAEKPASTMYHTIFRMVFTWLKDIPWAWPTDTKSP
jgi:hypothetical protein